MTRGHRPGSDRTRSSHPCGGRAHPARREGTSGGRRARRECPGGPPSPERPRGQGGADRRGFGGRSAGTDASSPRGRRQIVSWRLGEALAGSRSRYSHVLLAFSSHQACFPRGLRPMTGAQRRGLPAVRAPPAEARLAGLPLPTNCGSPGRPFTSFLAAKLRPSSIPHANAQFFPIARFARGKSSEAPWAQN